MSNKFIFLKTVQGVHYLIIICAILFPFLGNNFLLKVHMVGMPLIMVHWYFNNDKCFLTLIENRLKKELYDASSNDEESFTFKLFSKIYSLNHDYKAFDKFMYVIGISLWSFSIYYFMNIDNIRI